MDETHDMLSAMRQTLRGSGAPVGDSSTQEFPFLTSMAQRVVDAIEEEGPPQDGVQAIEQERQRMIVQLGSMELQLQSVEADESLSLLLDRIRGMHKDYEAELSRMHAALQAKNRALADASTAKLYKLSAGLYTCNSTFMAGIRSAPPINVPGTGGGHARGGGAGKTHGGGAVISRDATYKIPKRYADLMDVSMALAKGKASIDKWQQSLDECKEAMAGLREMHMKGVATLGSNPDDTQPHAIYDEVTDALEKGLNGLTHMGEYRQTRQVDNLRDGWNTLLESLIRLERAMSTVVADAPPQDTVTFGDDE